jgi:hypothetical protein
MRHERTTSFGALGSQAEETTGELRKEIELLQGT